jgi:hypothetical protein
MTLARSYLCATYSPAPTAGLFFKGTAKSGLEAAQRLSVGAHGRQQEPLEVFQMLFRAADGFDE